MLGPGDLDVPDLDVEGTDLPPMARPLLARDRVRYQGEALAVVVAESEREAVDAAELIWADIDPLRAVVTPEAALSDEVVIHPDVGTNVVDRSSVSDPGGWEFEVDVELTLRNQRLAPVPIEPLAVLAEPSVRGVRLWATHQAPHRLKATLRSLLGVEVEVIVPDVGGGFGMKGRFYPEYAVVAAAALRR